ncbi:hypothetical protein EDB85DRAFT_2119593 [Lactarius pseudohatsudake]|nr:hypothetical protein EDB85DRAFT_2119593 [Lactarius pseudohatsudake]
MLVLPAFLDLFNPPDPALRQPFTNAAFLPFSLSYYAMAVLVILPHTFVLRLSLLPFVLWQAWRCAVGLNLSAGLALSLGVENGDRLIHWDLIYVVGVIVMALRSTDWALTRKPLRRYEPFAEGQHDPVERPLTIPNVLLDACDLLCNQRGIRWSWGSKSFLRTLPPSPSLAAVVFKLLLKLTVYDMAIYIVRRIRPLLDTPAGDTFFDPHLDPLPRAALAGFLTLCGGLIAYTNIDMMYHIASLVGRGLLRQPAADWPAVSARPWTATSIADFWSFRWHQFLRHTLIKFGARPGGALFGRPGALLGAFGISAVLHYVGMWGVGRGLEFSSAGAFFVLMGVGVVLERIWQRTTGTQVRGFWGWVWTMGWTLFWGTFMLDGWARHGLIGCDFFSLRLRPGKSIVDGIITLTANNQLTNLSSWTSHDHRG